MTVSQGTGGTRSRSLLQTWRRYVGPTDDGLWNGMIKPGNTGYGIAPWIMDVDGCTCGNTHTNHVLTHGDPYYGLGLVKWAVPIDTSDELAPMIEKNYDITWLTEHGELTVPMLHLEYMVFPDHESATHVTVPRQGVDGHNYLMKRGQWVYTGPKVLLPIWAVVPVDERLWRDWRKEILEWWRDPAFAWLKAYDRVTSTDEWFAHDGNPGCFGLTDEEAEDGVPDDVAVTECQCGLDELTYKFVETLDTRDLDGGITTSPDTYRQASSYLHNRYDRGWYACMHNAIEGDEMSVVFGAQYSPYFAQHAAKQLTSYEQVKEFGQRCAIVDPGTMETYNALYWYWKQENEASTSDSSAA